jgi:hypothetical protein
MTPSKPVPRILQPEPDQDQQQQPHSNQSDAEQPAPEGQQQMGEGSYEATRDYQQNIKDYLKNADIEADAQAAKPRSQEEARELEQAEKQGRSHSKGER